MSESFPNFKQGLISSGVYTDRILFGGLTESTAGKANYEDYKDVMDDHLYEDRICRTCSITGCTIYPYDQTHLTCFRFIVSDTLTLNTGGSINCDGGGGVLWDELTGSPGFKEKNTEIITYGTVGGSGNGGACANPGGSGEPTSASQYARRWLGGNGGKGGAIGEGAVAGVASDIRQVQNWFAPSIYQNAVVFDNSYWLYDPFMDMLLPWRICGGGGGGGCGQPVSSTGRGGGAGGGVVYIAANRIVMAGGSISAKGQSCYAGDHGGGGGGGGGAVVLVCSELVWESESSTIDVSGGTNGGYGADDGENGNILLFSNQVFYRFDGGILDKDTYEQAVVKYQAKGYTFAGAY